MQIKTTMMYHLTQRTNTREGVDKGALTYTAGRNASGYSHYWGQDEGSLKTKDRATIWSRNPTSKRHMYPNFHSSTIYNSQHMETTEMFIDRWVDKEEVEDIQWNITQQ